MSRENRGAGGAAEPLEIVWGADGHPDDGSLRTWIDGEFGAIAAETVSVHVNRCAQCERDVADLRGYGAAASRLLLTLDRDVPAFAAPRAVTPRVARAWWERPVTRIAASALLAVGASTWMWREGRDVERTAPAQQAERVVVLPKPPATVLAPSMPGVAPAARVAASVTPKPRTDSTSRSARLNPPSATRGVAAAPAASPPSVIAVIGAPANTPREILLKGAIRDRDTQRPIEGASVSLVSTTIGTMTNAQGEYSVRVPTLSRGDTLSLRIRRIGYSSVVVTHVANADTVSVDAALSANITLLSVQVSSEHGAVQPREQVISGTTITTGLPVQPGRTDFSGKGVAGGIARGVESARKVSAPIASPENRLRSIGPRDSTRRDPATGNREQYDRIDDNPFLAVKGNPRSTFSIDVDRASYGNVRRFINDGGAPPPDAVRIEELVNYFPYDLEAPRGSAPIAITTETMNAPWQPKHKLVRIALQARRIETDALPPSNLVFLIDVSGSMMSADRLPLVKSSLRLLVEQLREQDRVSLVVYAGAAGLVLPSTSGSDKVRILQAIDRLEAGGSTAGGAGIQLAYRTAKESFLPNGNNRVILATDGDFNVGVSSDAEMERLIEEKRADGTYLTVLGFGRGNFQDAKMEKLAKRGNGNYAYVDDIAEARKTLVAEMGATLVTVANDVKLQVEFNPATVSAYRLIGYEDRLLATEDFADDRKDAGDMGAGHSVTALYEVVPAGVRGTVTIREQDALRYQVPAVEGASSRASRNELAFVNLRYKQPGDSTSVLLTKPVSTRSSDVASSDLRFAASVASFGMVLRNSEHRGTSSLGAVIEMAREAKGRDVGGYRTEFIGLVEKLASCLKAERASCQMQRR